WLLCSLRPLPLSFFSFNHTATTEIYTLSLHDALPISVELRLSKICRRLAQNLIGLTQLADLAFQRLELVGDLGRNTGTLAAVDLDRKSTRLNSSHVKISYAVFCLKKKKQNKR